MSGRVALPKSNSKRGLKRFTYKSHDLSSAAAAELAALLESESLTDRARAGIERALGLAVHGAQHIDNPPRPRDYISEFTRARAQAFELAERIANWDYYYRDELPEALASIEVELASLVDEFGRVIRRFENLGPNASRGARKNEALATSVRWLRGVFRDHYKGPFDVRQRRGAFEYRADWEKREADFVKVALLDARVIPASYAESELGRLMRDSRAQPGAQ